MLTKVECQTPSLNAVPDGCTIYLDRRLTIGESVESARAELDALPAVQAGEARVELLRYDGKAYTGLTLTTDKYFPTWLTDGDHPSVRAAIKATELALDRIPAVGRWIFSTNGVSSAGKLGIPTIGFGPANEVYAHSVDDQCPVDHLWHASAWYAAFPERYLAETVKGTQTTDRGSASTFARSAVLLAGGSVLVLRLLYLLLCRVLQLAVGSQTN